MAIFSRYFLYLLIIVGFALIGGVLAEASGPAQEGTPQPPQRADCAQCHLDIMQGWQTSAHALAFSDPLFQESWSAQQNNPVCLGCHTTGYKASEGTYAHAGVSCEACHGQTPENHPPAPMLVDPGVEVCADCHTTTLQEWKLSGHGEQQLACTTCHKPHPQTLRFETANELCLNCHQDGTAAPYEPTTFAHQTHVDQSCTDCHWFRPDPEDVAEHLVSGNLFPTGHTAHVETTSCTTCHAEEVLTSGATEEAPEMVEPQFTSANPALEAEVRIKELESEVDTVKAQAANNSALRVLQGVIVGTALGGIAIFTVMRFRRVASKTHIQPKEE